MSKRKSRRGRAEQPTYTTRILTPFWDPDHFKPDGDTTDWLEDRRSGLAHALMDGFDSEDKDTRQACSVLMQDLEVLTRAAAHALATGRRVDVRVELQPGCTNSVDYLDAVRDLTLAVALRNSVPCDGGVCSQGFRDLADLLREHMDAIGRMELRARAGAAA